MNNKLFRNLTPELTDKFNIEGQFDFYLMLVKLDKRTMPPWQIMEMKRCFYGAFGQLMLLLQEADQSSPAQLVDIYQYLTKQISDHFTIATAQKN